MIFALQKLVKPSKEPDMVVIFCHPAQARYKIIEYVYICAYMLTDCDIMRSMTSWEVSEQANEKGFPETAAASSTSPAMSSGIGSPPPHLAPLARVLESIWAGETALETSRAETLQERERNSMGSNGVSGGLNTACCIGSMGFRNVPGEREGGSLDYWGEERVVVIYRERERVWSERQNGQSESVVL